MTRPTPSSVNASLSRVCDAGSSQRFSRRLSRIRACGSLATPCTTLMRSNTTRRSAPITRSRLRRPTSKSTTTTFLPFCASAAPSAAVDVVLPTPPLPEVTTTTLVMRPTPPQCSVKGCYQQSFAFQPRLDRTVAKLVIDMLRGPVVSIDRHQLCLGPAAEDARLPVAVRTRHRTAAQRAVDVDRAARDDLRARGDRAEHGDVAAREYDGLP